MGAILLSPAAGPAEESRAASQNQMVERAKKRLLSAQECALLATAHQLNALGPIVELFSHAVHYAPGSGRPAGNTASLQLPGFKGLWHVLQLMVPPSELACSVPCRQKNAPASNGLRAACGKANQPMSIHAADYSNPGHEQNAPGSQPDVRHMPCIRDGSSHGGKCLQSPASRPRHTKRHLQPSLEFMLSDAKHSSGRRAKAIHQMRMQQAQEDATPKRRRITRPTPLKQTPAPHKDLCVPPQGRQNQHRQQTLSQLAGSHQPNPSQQQQQQEHGNPQCGSKGLNAFDESSDTELMDFLDDELYQEPSLHKPDPLKLGRKNGLAELTSQDDVPEARALDWHHSSMDRRRLQSYSDAPRRFANPKPHDLPSHHGFEPSRQVHAASRMTTAFCADSLHPVSGVAQDWAGQQHSTPRSHAVHDSAVQAQGRLIPQASMQHAQNLDIPSMARQQSPNGIRWGTATSTKADDGMPHRLHEARPAVKILPHEALLGPILEAPDPSTGDALCSSFATTPHIYMNACLVWTDSHFAKGIWVLLIPSVLCDGFVSCRSGSWVCFLILPTVLFMILNHAAATFVSNFVALRTAENAVTARW